jgi:hypothetical protein
MSQSERLTELYCAALCDYCRLDGLPHDGINDAEQPRDGGPRFTHLDDDGREVACQAAAIRVAYAALAQPVEQPGALRGREAMLRKLAANWIDTGENGTGLRKDRYTNDHRHAIMGIYGYCGKTLLEYLNYRALPPTSSKN